MEKLSVVILNYNRPYNLKNYIIPYLEKNKLVDEIIISHGKEKTAFDNDKGKIKNLQHWGEMNKEYGLTLRFLSALESKNEHILIMDDDIIPTHETIRFLKDKIEEEENIHGIYGRDINQKGEYIKSNVFGSVPMVLTRCLITTKSMCHYFISRFRSYEDEIISKSKPYWNGEDIVFNLLAIKKYNKLPKAYNLSHSNFLGDYLSFNGVSFDTNHDSYRKKLSQNIINKLNIMDKIKKETLIETTRNEFLFFLINSDLIYILIALALIIVLYNQRNEIKKLNYLYK